MKSALPKLSIITPTFNQADFIEETIQSVLNQNYPNLEYLVFDGGSTDGTINILKKYERSLRWVSRKDNGQSDALNQGFRQATGDVFAFLNSDDRYEPGAFQKVGEFFASHDNAKWLTGKCKVIDIHGNEIRKPVTAYKTFWLLLRSYKILLILDYISQPATFWHRSVIQKVGLFDEKLHYSMDYDYSLRVGRFFKLWFLNATFASYRIHPASKSGLVQKHFDTDLSIASRYTTSKVLQNLHSAHNKIIVRFYEKWQTPK